jgi:hypothetical protein
MLNRAKLAPAFLGKFAQTNLDDGPNRNQAFERVGIKERSGKADQATALNFFFDFLDALIEDKYGDEEANENQCPDDDVGDAQCVKPFF